MPGVHAPVGPGMALAWADTRGDSESPGPLLLSQTPVPFNLALPYFLSEFMEKRGGLGAGLQGRLEKWGGCGRLALLLVGRVPQSLFHGASGEADRPGGRAGAQFRRCSFSSLSPCGIRIQSSHLRPTSVTCDGKPSLPPFLSCFLSLLSSYF